MSAPEGGVNEETLKRLFAEFQLALFKELQATYATISALGDLQRVVGILESEVGKLKMWRSSQEGRDEEKKSFTATSLALAAVLAAVLTAVATIIWLKG